MTAKIRKYALCLKGQSLKFNEWVIIFGYVLIWLYAGIVTGIEGSYLLAGSFTLLLISYLLWLRPKIRRLSWKNFVEALGLGLLPLMVELIFLLIVIQFNNHIIGNSNTSLIIKLLQKNIIYVAYVVIIAPILEEIVFRKSFFHRVDAWLASWVDNSKLRVGISAFIVATVFAQMHGASIGIIYILLSLYFQFIYLHFSNLEMNIIAHITFNTSTLGLMVMASLM
ncbi:CPBP family intramembrane glutamic endopeptidase [Limosilactobacillus reuteri]|uniref:CPBP family intramembrane glutamic endopeptidase n=1 Tax=Limosilactobacillus reuteri TaxID=1598 RepID=UPI0021D1255F|nr:CPBP family intramembrane glutamic endopeptidase [Limosilactobacillus reuteri]MCU4692805.1 CPBP family intramembrane metalloprotease [Limosilactobacillus reuteri]